ncbi:hypothetical protein BGZ70_009365 [Mortierella alpina]|uniref:Uncharacterized protein n=1 Tax=Mortierella alpina TaxID=64518 RepID=A0A9P6M0F7_MORAP|nr:hypothetical protein BGZ70_009365 [Mortierella alpina]
MSPPHSSPWDPAEAGAELQSHERPVKTYQQEALYVAVERFKLYGQWAEVRNRMSLNRSAAEIEQEYMRLYGELADSDNDESDDNDHDDDNDDWAGHGRMTVGTAQYQRPGHVTPALTAASSLSARSSQETFSSHYGRQAHLPTPAASAVQGRRPQHRKPHAEYHDDETRATRMDVEPQTAASRLPSGKANAARSRTDSAVADAKPARTVRVWTQQQSEQLKNLIEDCFPGGYRINWVWVASQMGNTFTRKQCKNKWEIMRRRAGTEDEINLLKQGHEEFGPSWSQIQEKYLPERSQGGISIMWSLLQAREAEQDQQARQKHSTGPTADTRSEHARSTSGSPVRQRKEAVSMKVSMRPSSHGDSQGRRGKDRPYRPRVAPYPTNDEHEAPPPQAVDRETPERRPSEQLSYHESTSREASMSPLWSREGPSTGHSSYSMMHRIDDGSSKRYSVSSTESFSISASRQDPFSYPQSLGRHTPREAALELGAEPWTERNRPMTWTEPLTRRLEDIIMEHFPNHQKVNWVRVSSLMGTNPVVNKDQCKRRWYLMSQNNHLQLRQGEMLLTEDPSTSPMAIDADSMMSDPAFDRPPAAARHSKRSSEYVPWTDEEVDLLKQGVERFGRSWADIQQHYLQDRSVGSMASKWDYLLLKMRSTPKTSPSRARAAGAYQADQPGVEAEAEMEGDERADRYTDMEQDEGEH